MDIIVCITLDDDAISIARSVAPRLKGQALTQEHIEEGLIHDIVSDVKVVTSAVIMRPQQIGPSHLHDSGTGYTPDESTRQEL
jgi:hypothetical protein